LNTILRGDVTARSNLHLGDYAGILDDNVEIDIIAVFGAADLNSREWHDHTRYRFSKIALTNLNCHGVLSLLSRRGSVEALFVIIGPKLVRGRVESIDEV
jgi:hypothetical protein